MGSYSVMNVPHRGVDTALRRPFRAEDLDLACSHREARDVGLFGLLRRLGRLEVLARPRHGPPQFAFAWDCAELPRSPRTTARSSPRRRRKSLGSTCS